MSPRARTSEVLVTLAAQPSDRLTVGDIVAVLRGRAFALLVVLLGLPNCLPMPPPIPLVCGLLLALVAAQIAAGRAAPWLPQALMHRSVAKADVVRAVNRALPVLYRLERWSKPRMTHLQSAVAARAIGFMLLALSFGLLVAAPIIGQIPLGIAVCFVGLGLVERDGVMVLAGLVIGAFGLSLSVSFAYAIVAALQWLF